MGVNIKTAELLVWAQRNGVEFEKVVTIGRQRLHGSKALFQQLFNVYGLSKAKLQEILNVNQRFGEGFFKLLGAEEVDSIDASEYENATIVHDMNFPIPAGYRERYSVVLDGGSLEHIFNFPTAIKNCMEMVKMNGHFVGSVPANNFFGHGFYQFSPELYYRVFSERNGFKVERMVLYFDEFRSPLYEVSDPLVIRERVRLRNFKETYLFIQARRIAKVDLLANYPQQSDYEFIQWHAEPSLRKNNRGDGFANFAKYFVPPLLTGQALRVQRFLKDIISLIRPIGNGNRKAFRRVSMDFDPRSKANWK